MSKTWWAILYFLVLLFAAQKLITMDNRELCNNRMPRFVVVDRSEVVFWKININIVFYFVDGNFFFIRKTKLKQFLSVFIFSLFCAYIFNLNRLHWLKTSILDQSEVAFPVEIISIQISVQVR